jgi:hypothetical protein
MPSWALIADAVKFTLTGAAAEFVSEASLHAGPLGLSVVPRPVSGTAGRTPQAIRQLVAGLGPGPAVRADTRDCRDPLLVVVSEVQVRRCSGAEAVPPPASNLTLPHFAPRPPASATRHLRPNGLYLAAKTGV